MACVINRVTGIGIFDGAVAWNRAQWTGATDQTNGRHTLCRRPADLVGQFQPTVSATQ